MEPYIGEIRMFAGSYAPQNWAFCQGQILSIADFDALFSLIGTTYGGDGQTNFNLPNLQSCLAVHQGTDSGGISYSMGQNGGVEQVTLNTNQLGTHNHTMGANNGPGSGSSSGAGAIFAVAGGSLTPYGSGTNLTHMSGQVTTYTGGNQPHSNIKPFLCVNFIIALYGIFPTQS